MVYIEAVYKYYKFNMEACSRAAVMGSSLQQPVWVKGSAFPLKGEVKLNGVRLWFVKPCKASQLDGSLVSGRPPSSVSVPIPEMGGNFSNLRFIPRVHTHKTMQQILGYRLLHFSVFLAFLCPLVCILLLVFDLFVLLYPVGCEIVFWSYSVYMFKLYYKPY